MSNLYSFVHISMKNLYSTLAMTLTISLCNVAMSQMKTDTSQIGSFAVKELDEIAVSGTLKETKKLESPVPVEVYKEGFFFKNPSFHIFEGMLHINGVRPQNSCNICNTGDIRINGLPGPYTMVLIDGMPIMSSLSTVYGLSGIPTSIIEQVEIVKGPASTLYGSEAIGGVINIITKKPETAPKISTDVFASTWREVNADIGISSRLGKKISSYTGLNYLNYSNPIDQNNDGFTDLSLQQRISIFQKWTLQQRNEKKSSLIARYVYEDRWGGEMTWNKSFRGSDLRYGESIFTNRLELFGNISIPTKEDISVTYAYNHHHQNSVYGTTRYIGQQNVAFAQAVWNKRFLKQDWLLGSSIRHSFYNDNTPATGAINPLSMGLRPQLVTMPGVFMQMQSDISPRNKLLVGLRHDYHPEHGNIVTPRLAYKYEVNSNNLVRLNMGTGFRVVNIFTEDHAALSGAREVIIEENLNPERSYNINLNYLKKINKGNKNIAVIDISVFYTHFNNRIIGDFETDPSKIIYANLTGYAISKGLSFNIDARVTKGLKVAAGATLMDVSLYEQGKKERQLFTETFSGTWTISYKLPGIPVEIDYTGFVSSPMRLPLLGPLDPRDEYSPWYSIQNIQFVYRKRRDLEIYGGIKNLLNFLPFRNTPFLIARANDPFDKRVDYNNNGQIIPTTDNPYALSFDPTYMFAPNQGIRGFFGIRYSIR